MCGRFASWSDKNRILDHYRLGEGPDLQPGYNIHPGRDIAVIREADGRDLVNMHWGFLPHWAKDKKFETSNATAEKLAAGNPFFRDAFRHRRCLIPADGYYEWYQHSRPRQPLFFRLQETDMFSLAGIWDTWESPDGPRRNCAVVTTAASPAIAPLHHRMPVIVTPDRYDAWLLDGDRALLAPYAGDMTVWAVSTRVNRPDNQGMDLIQAVPWPAGVPTLEQQTAGAGGLV